MPGFVPAPDGMLCQVSFWDGSAAWVGYVTAPGGKSQIGRLVDYPAAGEGAQVVDYAYDGAGRLAAARSPLVAAAAATSPPIVPAGDTTTPPGSTTTARAGCRR